jgi:hypothetical protein
MTNSIYQQDKIFEMLSRFFNIDPTDYYSLDELEYENSESEFINRVNNSMINHFSFLAENLIKILDTLMIIIFPITAETQFSQVVLISNPISGQGYKGSMRSIKNYGGFYTGREYNNNEDDDKGLKYNKILLYFLQFFNLSKRQNQLEDSTKIHREGRMYRGHSLD